MNFYRILSVEMRKFDIFLTVSNPFSWQKMEYFNIFGLLWQKRQKNLPQMRPRAAFLPPCQQKRSHGKKKRGAFRSSGEASQGHVATGSESTFSAEKCVFPTLNNKQ